VVFRKQFNKFDFFGFYHAGDMPFDDIIVILLIKINSHQAVTIKTGLESDCIYAVKRDQISARLTKTMVAIFEAYAIFHRKN
jgi:hypothetical protein